MTAHYYEGMDNSGNEVRGFLDAESVDEVQARLGEQGIFVTKIAAFAPEVTPEWAAVSLASPSSIPFGRLLAQGLPCTHEQRGMTFEGSLNLLGVGGELHLILDKPGGGGPILELPVQTIKEVKWRGLFRKKLLVTELVQRSLIGFRSGVKRPEFDLNAIGLWQQFQFRARTVMARPILIDCPPFP